MMRLSNNNNNNVEVDVGVEDERDERRRDERELDCGKQASSNILSGCILFP
jgi:hypothetical protein